MTRLPAIHARYRDNPSPQWRAQFPNEVLEFQEGFTFLDDGVHPLALRWQYRLATLEVIRINNVRLNLKDSDPPAASGPPAASDAPASGLAQELEDGLARRGVVEVPGIYFDTGSAAIRPESGPAIAAIAEALSKNASLKVSIEGHTDNQGGEQYNLDLSRTRAEAVRTVLIEKHLIDKGRMTTRGHGYSKPKADNSTLLGRAQNRRVELVRF
jgi:outer membrane protein OmpA-like peptidoglycan-associated protein